MAFENINLDNLAEQASQIGKGASNKNMVWNKATNKFEIVGANQSIPEEGVIANQMSTEGFA
ncbi:MAG TPA: hypothetical protein DEO38_05885 [Bacteroidales bacterium]|nr:hypothetical protein [Bacteroidales bacterium]